MNSFLRQFAVTSLTLNCHKKAFKYFLLNYTAEFVLKFQTSCLKRIERSGENAKDRT